MLVVALGASRHMPAKRLCPAGLYRRHDFELAEADMPGIGPPPRWAELSEDVSDLQRLPGHRPQVLIQPSSERVVPQLLEVLEWADRIADRLGGDVCISRRRA